MIFEKYTMLDHNRFKFGYLLENFKASVLEVI